MTIADLSVNRLVEFLQSGNSDHIPANCLDQFKHVLAASEKLVNEPKIAAWIEAHSNN